MRIDTISRYHDMTGDEILRNQEKKLKEHLRYRIYPFSPYYRKLFDDNGIDPSSVNTIADLERIPLTRKEDIMPNEMNLKRYKDFILQPDMEKIKRFWPKQWLLNLKMRQLMGKDVRAEIREEYYPSFMIATSGTTGNNVPFMYTNYDIKLFTDAYCSLIDQLDVDMDWVLLNVFPFAPHLAFTFVYWANLGSPIRMFHTGGGSVTSTVKTLDVIKAVDANVIVGIPSYIYHLLNRAKSEDRDLSGIKMLLTAGEKLSGATRARLEEILTSQGATDFRIVDVFGTTEMRDAYAECTPGSGVFHIHPNIHIAEMVDPETGKQMKPGESGSLAITNIDGRGTQVVRFLIGDVFEGGIQYGKCELCGREIPRIVGPIGRMRDYSRKLDLTKVKGTLLNLNIFYDLIPAIEGVVEWQVCIEKRNNDPSEMDLLKINIAPDKGVKKKELARKVKDAVNDAIEINAVVDTSFTSDKLFERMGGKLKAQRIVDLRPER